MDRYTLSTASLNTHQVEIYTSTLIIRGNMLGPFHRTSDLVNRRDRHNLIVQDATLAPLGSSATPKAISDPVFVPRPHIHVVVALPTVENTTDPHLSGALNTGSLTPPSAPTTPSTPVGPLTARGLLSQTSIPSHQRDFHVQRQPKPCYIFTSTLVVSGLCHLLEGSTIEQILDSQDPFFPLTQGVLYLHSYPNSPWRRDLILINKEMIETVYTTDPRPPQQPPSPSEPSALKPLRQP
jgi:hypothetical protein